MGGGRYGKSFAQKYIQERDFERALAEAERAMELDADDARPHADKGEALHRLMRFKESVEALERAIALNQENPSLHDDDLDDLYFESVRAHAMAVREGGDRAAAAAILDQYARVLPKGTHRADCEKWYAEIRR